MAIQQESKIDQLRQKWRENSQNSDQNTQDRSDYFASSHPDVNLKRFTLYCRSGRIVSLPYASLPVIELNENELSIKASGWQVIITGRNLAPIMKALQVEQVNWIKESETGLDTMDSPTFVKKFQIQGSMFDIEPE